MCCFPSSPAPSNRWWSEQQGAAGYGRQILQGMLRCCRYTKPEQRESRRRWLATGDHEPVDKELDGLCAWNDPQLREEFSLQALRVIGKLNGNGDGKRRTHWLPLDLQRRVELEYTFQLVTDILNKEAELRLREAWRPLIKHEPEHWIVTLSQHR